MSFTWGSLVSLVKPMFWWTRCVLSVENKEQLLVKPQGTGHWGSEVNLNYIRNLRLSVPVLLWKWCTSMEERREQSKAQAGHRVESSFQHFSQHPQSVGQVEPEGSDIVGSKTITIKSQVFTGFLLKKYCFLCSYLNWKCMAISIVCWIN